MSDTLSFFSRCILLNVSVICACVVVRVYRETCVIVFYFLFYRAIETFCNNMTHRRRSLRCPTFVRNIN